MTPFDYVIVGAGSAGCVLANRLSADPGVSVLLIEAGDRDTNPLIAMPRGFGELFGDPAAVWHYPIRAFGPSHQVERRAGLGSEVIGVARVARGRSPGTLAALAVESGSPGSSGVGSSSGMVKG